MTTALYTQSLLQCVNTLPANGISMTYTTVLNESLIQRARNLLAHKFMQSDCTHLMFIDADIRFDAHDIVKMVQADKEVICGIYPKKEINWAGVAKAAQDGVGIGDLKNHTGSFVVNLVDYSGSVTVPVNEPFRIWNGGTGFMLIKREVFSKLQGVVHTYNNDVLDLAGQFSPELMHEYFPVFVDEDKRLLSEDYAFCKLCRTIGIDIWGAPWVRLGHFGSYLFEGGFAAAP